MEAREEPYKQRELQLEKNRIELEKKGIVKYQNNVPNVVIKKKENG